MTEREISERIQELAHAIGQQSPPTAAILLTVAGAVMASDEQLIALNELVGRWRNEVAIPEAQATIRRMKAILEN